MRAMFMVVASIVLAVGLFGCNRQQQVAEQAPIAVVPPPPAAAPPPPAPPAPPAPVMEATRHLRHHHGQARRSSYESYSESESTSYTQSEDSESDYDNGSVMSYRDAGAAEAHGEVWVDGYGREHTAVATPDDNPGALSREDERLRHKVWRGWNSDCDRR